VRLHVLAYLLVIVMCGVMGAQTGGDVLGMHDLSSSGQITTSPAPVSTTSKGMLSACQFCHAPHSGLGNSTPLWSQQLSTSSYTLRSDTTNAELQPTLGSASSLCLSCHDGTVALGQTTPYGNVNPNKDTFNDPYDIVGSDLANVHPFNLTLPLKQTSPTPTLLDSVVAGTGTGNPAVKLIDKNVQCTSCHDPHYQSIDKTSNFLVMDNTGSALCLACHTTAPTPVAMAAKTVRSNLKRADAMSVTNSQKVQTTSLSAWRLSAHATASHKVNKGVNAGRYATVSRNACLSCHSTHKGMGGMSLLSAPATTSSTMDATTQNCAMCHNGTTSIQPALPSVMSEFSKSGHPLPTTNNKHTSGEAAVLNGNRHATCTDCHNPHASAKSDSLVLTTIRKAQAGATGISMADGTSVLSPALNQYETCLRCHGTSTGKQTLALFGYMPLWSVSAGDPLNVIAQFSATASSAHPVMRDRNSAFPQPSLLQYIWNLDGRVQGRTVGPRILCTDCHNSDDNREFGGNGPNGPHGSLYPHILERRYEMSQVTPLPAGGPGSKIQNLFPNPVLDPACNSVPCASPYGLCAKCHDLKNIVSNASFSEHARHINDGFSCSVCHTSHGMGASSASVSGERMVNFDANVVASNGGSPISYSRPTNSCSLVCHGHAHALRNGSTTPVAVRKK
jgi:predicted CXXCH cytochrome family protein